ARTLDRRVPRPDSRAGRRVVGRERLRDARGRLLAIRGRGAEAVRGRLTRRRRRARYGRGPRNADDPWSRDLVARLLPEQSPPGPRRAEGGERPPPARNRRGARARRRDRRHVRRARPDEDPPRELRGVPHRLAGARRLRLRAWRPDRDRELPDALLLRRVARWHESRRNSRGLGRDVLDRGQPELRAQARRLTPRMAPDRLRARRPRLRRQDLPRPRQGPGDRPRRPLPERDDLARDGLAGAAPPGTGRGALEPLRGGALSRRLRLRRLGRARGPLVRGQRGARRARLPDRARHVAPAHSLTARRRKCSIVLRTPSARGVQGTSPMSRSSSPVSRRGGNGSGSSRHVIFPATVGAAASIAATASSSDVATPGKFATCAPSDAVRPARAKAAPTSGA